MKHSDTIFHSQSSNIECLTSKCLGLKILGPFIGSCQFKSGSGHQKPFLSRICTSLIRLIATPPKRIKNSQKEYAVKPYDTTHWHPRPDTFVTLEAYSIWRQQHGATIL